MTYKFVVTGGGTGGHVIPALAIAESIQERGDEVCLIGTKRGLENHIVPKAGFDLVTLRTQPFRGTGMKGIVTATWLLFRETLTSLQQLRVRKSEIVISVGGYAAAPVTLAALLLRLPLVLVEPNAVPGFANRLVARAARRIFITFERTEQRLLGHNNDERIRQVGVPLLRKLVAELESAAPPRHPIPPFRIFIFGGSQGSHQINESIVAALPALSKLPLHIVHQTGQTDYDRVAHAYSNTRIVSEVVSFESEMAKRYRWADLVICRSGALTIAELALAQKASLLIPLGHVGGGEQVENAQALEKVGAARVLPSTSCTPDSLFAEIERILEQPHQMIDMGKRARSLAHPDAALRLVDECVELLKNEVRPD